MNELTRLIRHGMVPLAARLVAKGYLPEYMLSDVSELLTIGAALAIPMIWSRFRAPQTK